MVACVRCLVLALAAAASVGCGLILSSDESRRASGPGAEATPSATDSAAVGADTSRDAPTIADATPVERPAIAVDPEPLPLDPRVLLSIAFDGSPYSSDDAVPAPKVESVEVASSDGRQGGRLGEESLVAVPNAETLSGLSAFTVEFWARFDSVVAPGTRVALADKHGEWSLFVFPEGELRFTAGTVSTGGIFFCTIDPLKWTHIALVVDRGNASFSGFVNGQRCGSGDAGTQRVRTGAPMHFGSDSPTENDRFIGMLSDIRFWGVALSDGEVCARAEGCEP